MTEEQRNKARAALLYKKLDDFEKSIALDRHFEAIQWIDLYNLPYRIALDYLKGSSPDYVRINPCYPFPGYCKDDLIHLTPNDVDIAQDLTTTPKDKATKKQIKELCAKLRPWNLSTAAGIEQWKKYFAHFINAADFDSYTSFDWFGAKVAAYSQEQNKKINFWKCLHADYHLHPEDYLQEELLKADYDLEKYTTNEFIIDWNTSPNSAM